jgi:hypothetical protein
LVIAVLDRYKTTSQRLKFFRRKELLIEQLIQSLNEQKFVVETDLLLIMRATHLEEERINELISQPHSGLFEDPDIADAANDFLGEGYTLYLSALARCETALEDIAKDISGLLPSPQVGNPRVEFES